MVRPDTRCPPSTHGARDWAKGARPVIHLSNVLLSSSQRTDPSPDDEPLKRAASLLEDAERCQEQGRFEDAEKLVAQAKNLVAGNPQACAEIDLLRAISLLKANKREEGVRNLSEILAEYADWFKTPDSPAVYE